MADCKGISNEGFLSPALLGLHCTIRGNIGTSKGYDIINYLFVIIFFI